MWCLMAWINYVHVIVFNASPCKYLYLKIQWKKTLLMLCLCFDSWRYHTRNVWEMLDLWDLERKKKKKGTVYILVLFWSPWNCQMLTLMMMQHKHPVIQNVDYCGLKIQSRSKNWAWQLPSYYELSKLGPGKWRISACYIKEIVLGSWSALACASLDNYTITLSQ